MEHGGLAQDKGFYPVHLLMLFVLESSLIGRLRWLIWSFSQNWCQLFQAESTSGACIQVLERSVDSLNVWWKISGLSSKLPFTIKYPYTRKHFLNMLRYVMASLNFRLNGYARPHLWTLSVCLIYANMKCKVYMYSSIHQWIKVFTCWDVLDKQYDCVEKEGGTRPCGLYHSLEQIPLFINI